MDSVHARRRVYVVLVERLTDRVIHNCGLLAAVEHRLLLVFRVVVAGHLDLVRRPHRRVLAVHLLLLPLDCPLQEAGLRISIAAAVR